MFRHPRDLSMLVAGVLAFAGCTSDGSRPRTAEAAPVPTVTVTQTIAHSPAPEAALRPVGCRTGDALANVSDRGRYELLENCKIAKGLVVMSYKDVGGNQRIGIDLNHELEWLLDDGNRTAQGGMMIAQIVPADSRGCGSGCTGANLTAPVVGDYIEFSGPLVRNTQGWREIHPLWRWVMLNPSPSRSAARPRAPLPSQRCHPSYRGACLDKRGDYDCREGSGDGPNFTGEVQVVGPDVYDLDRNDNGIGCDGQ